MATCNLWSNGRLDEDVYVYVDVVNKRYRVSIIVDDELIAGVEGWRRAHGLKGQPEAMGELVRLGLMSEIARIYRRVCGEPADGGERRERSARRGKPARPAGKSRAASSPQT